MFHGRPEAGNHDLCQKTKEGTVHGGRDGAGVLESSTKPHSSYMFFCPDPGRRRRSSRQSEVLSASPLQVTLLHYFYLNVNLISRHRPSAKNLIAEKQEVCGLNINAMTGLGRGCILPI